MANALYPKFKETILHNTSVDLSADASNPIKVALMDKGTISFDTTHQFYSSVVTGLVGTPVEITSRTITNGVFDGADVTFSSVSGSTVEALVIYRDTGANTTSDLIAFIDDATGLAVTPNGGNITVTWNASGIFSL